MHTLLNKGLALIFIAALLYNTACTKAKYDDDFKKGDVPPVGSYTKADDVAAANLVAHWTFDSTNEESLSHAVPTKLVNNSFVKGIKGPALHLNAGYLLYPVIDNLNKANGLGSVTVSMWINVDNNGKKASSFFALTPLPDKQTDWGSVINIYAETGHPIATDDTLALHSAVGNYKSGNRAGGDNINDYGTREQDFLTVHGTNKWIHYVMKYDGAASTIDLYANSLLVSNKNFRQRGTLGPLVSPVPVQSLIGGWPNSDTGFPLSGAADWQGLLTGSIDEIRIYNTALNDFDIHALYFFEKYGK